MPKDKFTRRKPPALKPLSKEALKQAAQVSPELGSPAFYGPYSPMLVIERLYVGGSREDITGKSFRTDKENIACINCTGDERYRMERFDYPATEESYDINFAFGFFGEVNTKELERFDKLINRICDLWRQGKTVYVHCYAGRDRSSPFFAVNSYPPKFPYPLTPLFE